MNLLLIYVNLTYSAESRSGSSELNLRKTGKFFSHYYLGQVTGIQAKFPIITMQSKSYSDDKGKYNKYPITLHHHLSS